MAAWNLDCTYRRGTTIAHPRQTPTNEDFRNIGKAAFYYFSCLIDGGYFANILHEAIPIMMNDLA